MARFDINMEAIANIGWNGFISPANPVHRELIEAAVREAPGGIKETIDLQNIGNRTARLSATHPGARFVIFGHGELVPTGNYGGNGLWMHWINKLGQGIFAKHVREVPPNNFLMRACLAIGLRAR